MKTILYILAVCVTGGLLLCVLSVYAGSSIIVNGTGPTHIVGAREGNVRGYTVYIPSSNYCDGRFTIFDANTNVVIDNDSGLVWTRNANIGGKMDWINAVNYCAALEANGYSDWRLPSIDELSRYSLATGLVDAYPSANNPALPLGHPFVNIQAISYWSGTEWATDPAYAWLVVMQDGDLIELTKTFNNNTFAWPCRGP